jgi:hypothetical protein
MHSTHKILTGPMLSKSKTACLTLGLPLLAVSALPLAAQEAPAPTPPELRDFRLDPKPAEKPPEQPTVAEPPVAQPAPVVVPPQPKVEPRAATPKPRAEPAPAKTVPSETTIRDEKKAEPPKAAPELKVEPLPTEAVTPSNSTPSEPKATPDVTAQLAAPSLPFAFAPWMGWSALATLAALLSGWLFLRRRRVSQAADDVDMVQVDYQPAPTDPQIDAGDPAPLRAAIDPKATRTPWLHADFTPEQAQLTLANFTISGRLALHNVGKAQLRDVKVRTTMISACEGQNALISEFHADEGRGHTESIGDARAGEEIALSLEIQQPRVELNEFDWRERRFMAPIVLIHLSGRGPQGLEHAELSCLIGRESDAETQRMKPFHTDRGPRRFEGLGYRAVSV